MKPIIVLLIFVSVMLEVLLPSITSLMVFINITIFIVLSKLNLNFNFYLILSFLLLVGSSSLKKSNEGFKYDYEVNEYSDSTFKVLYFPDNTSFVRLSSVDIDLPLIISISSIFILFFYSLKNKSISISWLFKVFYVMLLVAVIGFLYSFSKGNNGILISIKIVSYLALLILAYQSGIKKKYETQKFLELLFFNFTPILLYLLALGIFTNHIKFFIFSLSSSLLWYNVYNRKIKSLILIIPPLLFVIYHSAFTLKLCFLIVSFLSLCFFYFKNLFKKSIVLLTAFYLFSLLFVIFTGGDKVYISGAQSLSSRLFNKVYSDRYYVWLYSLLNLDYTNIFISIPGEINTFEDVFKNTKELTFGSHNLLLQLFRQIGIIPGFLFFASIIKLFIEYVKYPLINSESTFILIAIISLFFSYGLTGHAIIGHPAAILYWYVFGLTLSSLKVLNLHKL